MKCLFQIIVFTLFVASCTTDNADSMNTESLDIHRVHCLDTGLVWIQPYNENKDTIFRLYPIEVAGHGELEDGKWIIYYDKEFTEKVYECTSINNKKDGVYTYYLRNGNKSFEGVMKDGFKNGLSKSWYKNGQLEYSTNYSNDTIVGIQENWNKTGELETIPNTLLEEGLNLLTIIKMEQNQLRLITKNMKILCSILDI